MISAARKKKLTGRVGYPSNFVSKFVLNENSDAHPNYLSMFAKDLKNLKNGSEVCCNAA